MPTSVRSRRHLALISVIQAARKEAGLSQRQLAAKMKVSQSMIATIESGQRRMDVVEFMDFARVLRIDSTELLARIERMLHQ
jgi:ribosome-binding protein aMBF1 (putative translation factor)